MKLNIYFVNVIKFVELNYTLKNMMQICRKCCILLVTFVFFSRKAPKSRKRTEKKVEKKWKSDLQNGTFLEFFFCHL